MTTFFGLAGDRANMLHPAYDDGSNTNPYPLGIFLGLNGDFVNTWIPGGSKTVPNNFLTLGAFTTAPDGTNTAQKLVEAATNQTHSIVGGLSMSSAANYLAMNLRFAVFLKAAERTRAVLSLRNNQFNFYNGVGTPQFPGAAGIKAVFDLAGGQVAVAASSFGSGFVVSSPATIVPFPNGWYLCTINGIGGLWYQANAYTVLAYVYIDAGSGLAAENSSYAGNGTSGIYAWKGNCLPSDAYNMTNQFFDDFTSTNTIDINDTRMPGFNWYVTNAWPRWNNTLQPSLIYGVNNDFDLATPSILTCHCRPGRAISFNEPNYLFTAYWDGATGFGGHAFGSPAFFECLTAWGTPATPRLNIGVWPAFWSAQPFAMAFPATAPTYKQQREVDFAEGDPDHGLNTPGWSFFQQRKDDFIGGGLMGELKQTSYFQHILGMADPDFTQYHKYGTMTLGGNSAVPLPVAVGQHNILPNTSFVGAGATSATPPTRMSWTGVPAGVTITTTVTNEVYRFRIVSAGGLVGVTDIQLNLNVSPFNSANGTIGPDQIWTASVYFRIAAGNPDVTFNKVFNIQEYDTSGNILQGGNSVSTSINFSDPTILTRSVNTYRTQIPACARLRVWLDFATFSTGVFDVTYEISQPQLELSAMATPFQPSTGSDTQGVAGVSFANVPAYYLRNLQFFDSCHFASADYIPDTKGLFLDTNPGVQSQAIISVTPNGGTADTTWITSYDWVSILSSQSSQLPPSSLTIQDSASTNRQTQALDVSTIGSGPWDGGRLFLDNQGTLQGTVTSTNALQVSPGSGTTREVGTTSSTQISLASSALGFTLLVANPARLSANIFNDSTQILYVLVSSETDIQTGALVQASSTKYTAQVAAGGNYEVPLNYIGPIGGVWASANGFARITEITSP